MKILQYILQYVVLVICIIGWLMLYAIVIPIVFLGRFILKSKL